MTTPTKTYSRAIDLRARIEADPVLQSIDYEMITVTVDGKKKKSARFFYDTMEQAMVIRKAGFSLKPKEEGDMPKPKAKTMAEKAMLASLTIKGWSGRATDNEAAAHTAMHYQANAEWTKFTKALVNKGALKDVKKAEAAARATHKEFTLPWNEQGQRLLPAAAFHDYQTKMGQHRDDHEAAVDRLIADFDDLVEEARTELGGLFNPAEYPDSAELQAKFLFDMELTTLDVTGDFRVEMTNEEMERLQDEITKRTETRLAAAMTDVYQRLHAVVTHMADRLRAYNPEGEGTDKEGNTVKRVENPFRDATLNNVREIVDLMPKLNVTGDPALDDLAREVRQNLLDADAKTLRTDEQKRAEVAQRAEEIAGAMAGMM